MKLFAVKYRCFFDVFVLYVLYKMFWAQFPDFASKNEAVCCEVQTHSGSFPLASFTEKVLGTISRFVNSETKLFPVKFRRISKVLCLQGLQKKFWAQFHDLCPKMKLLAVKFSCIFDLFAFQAI